MSYTISIYSDTVFVKYLLPEISDGIYCLSLMDEKFHLGYNLDVNMDVTDKNWSFLDSKGRYLVKKSGQNYFGQIISDQDELLLVSQSKQGIDFEMHILVRKNDPVYHPYLKLKITDDAPEIRIGRGESNDIEYDFGNNRVSRNHAVLRRNGAGFTFYHTKGENPTYLNNEKIEVGKSQPLQFGDTINIVGLDIIYLGDVLAIDMSDAVHINAKDILQPFKMASCGTANNQEIVFQGYRTFHRSPRNYDRTDDSTVEIENPPELGAKHQMSVSMAVGPAISMALPMALGCVMMMSGSYGSGMYMFSGLVMALSSAGVGSFWAWKNIRNQQREEEENRKLRNISYRQYIEKKTEIIRQKYESTRELLRNQYPETAVCAEYTADCAALWNRNQSHEDFLTYRLGKGSAPFPVSIDVPTAKFQMYDDELATLPVFVKEEYGDLHDVPVCIDISKHKLIGVVGEKENAGALEIAKNLVVQIAANNCYTDVKIGAIYNGSSERESQMFSELKRLPHVWSADRKVRFLVNGRESHQDVFYELMNIFRNIREMKENEGQKHSGHDTYYVLFFSNTTSLKEETLGKLLLSADNTLPVTSVFLVDDYEKLPNECDFIIENDENFSGMYRTSDPKDKRRTITFDHVDDRLFRAFTHHLANVRVDRVEQGGELPESLSFFDMYGIKRPEDLHALDRWKRSRIDQSIKGLLGWKSGGNPCYLDLHEKMHGPHGLIAGTTGSGKSETLQTYLLSLAINYSPDDISYFIIDYKGGGMAKLFDGLPHMIGQISNLSGNQVRRAMISIRSENRRRERVFAEYGVNNINAYTKLYKSGEATQPIPHLIIIIDEFAELKDAEPEFMQQLISVAQVGRSLGVHLILATQKPGGKVDPNIWSNSRFRICLRVQDAEDSKDMLHKPDAAYLTHAGRAYLQVGNDEVYELFQSGYSGAIYNEEFADEKLDSVRLLRLDGSTETTGSLAKSSHKTHTQYIWIKRLIKCLHGRSVLHDMSNENVTYAEQKTAGSDSSQDDAVDYRAWYKEIADSGLDYPDTPYNTAGLHNLYALYKEVSLKNGGDIAADILNLSKKKNIRLPQFREKTQLEAVRNYLAKVAEEEQYSAPMQLWMPVLKNKIYLDDLKKLRVPGGMKAGDHRWSCPVIIGQFDDPANQQQPVFTVDFAEAGNIAVYGTPMSGKSTLMQTLVYSCISNYSADEINIYSIDFSSSMLKDFTCTAAYSEEDIDEIPSLFEHIEMILSERVEKYRGKSFRDVAEAKGITDPIILLLIDNFAKFNEETEGEYEKLIVNIAKDGLKYGIHVVVSGGTVRSDDIPSRLADSMQTVICLQLNEKSDYGILLRENLINMPEQGIKGRGLAKYDGRVLEFQTCLAVRTENDYDRPECIRNYCEELLKNQIFFYSGERNDISENPDWEDFRLNGEVRKAEADKRLLPVGYDLSFRKIYSIPLRDTICFMINGEDPGEQINMMEICIESARTKDNSTLVSIIDNFENPILTNYQDKEDVEYIDNKSALNKFILGTERAGESNVGRIGLIKDFQDRNRKKNVLKEKLPADEGAKNIIFDEMSKEFGRFIFITDFSDFIRQYKNLFPNSENREKALKFLQSFFEHGKLHNIYFFTMFTKEQMDALAGDPVLFKAFTADGSGVHLGGRLNSDATMKFNYLKTGIQWAETKPNVAYVSTYYHMLQRTDKIVIPKLR